ncbi:MAG: hypothetical protein K6E16_07090 [Lachnospiraceae bacterium]|nr:hypothetical protein [Lachnospiraceae bacterium]
MAMNGIGQFDLYNSYRLNRVEEQDALRNAEQNKVQVSEESVSAGEPKEVSLSLNLDGIRERNNMALSDVSLTMNQSGSASFEMKSLTFQPEKDEMDKAFSDVQKDSALMRYSYFVGESNVIMDNEDGVVLRKVNPEG